MSERHAPPSSISLPTLLLEDYGIVLPDVDEAVAVQCPFHRLDAGDASLVVNPRQGTYRCATCRITGNVVTYLTTWRNYTLDKAIRSARQLPRLTRRPGRAAVAAFRRRAREDARNTLADIMSLPLWAGGPALYEALLPTADATAHAHASRHGVLADWPAQALYVAPTALQALLDAHGVETDVRRLLTTFGLPKRNRRFRRGRGWRVLVAYTVPLRLLPGFTYDEGDL